MPNLQNVAGPINIHGFGRSGTTLLQNIFDVTGYIQCCGETNGFVFCCYRGGQVLSAPHDKQAPGSTETVAARALHAALCAAMPSDKPSWCQKLGGIPNQVVFETLIGPADRRYAALPYAFPYAWFWRVLANAFPQSSVLMLRDWRDVVISRSRFSGYRPEDVAHDLAVYYNVMAHPESRIDQVIRLEALVAAPEATLAGLFGQLGLLYTDSLLEGLRWYAAPSPSRRLSEAREAAFSWREQHDAVLGPELHRLMAEPTERLAARLQLDPGELGVQPVPRPRHRAEQPLQKPT